MEMVINRENYDSNATENNIYYMFQRLITPIIISMTYRPYEEFWDDYQELYEITKEWIQVYYNKNDLRKIEKESLNKFDSILTDLKFSCLVIDTRFIEEIDIWHNEFLKLYKNSFEIR